VHLDHGDEETCYDCINSGFFSSVMIDASHDPFDKNVEITKRVVDKAHAKASPSKPSSACSAVSRGHQGRRGPRDAYQSRRGQGFRRQDRLRLPGLRHRTSHGAFKFKGKQSLHFDVLTKIKALLPGFPLVMHGSSSVPQDEVARINAAGGTIAGSMGVDVNEYLPPPSLASQDQHRYRRSPRVDPRAPRVLPRQSQGVRLPPAGQDLHREYAKFIASRNVLLGSANQLDDLRKSLGK